MVTSGDRLSRGTAGVESQDVWEVGCMLQKLNLTSLEEQQKQQVDRQRTAVYKSTKYKIVNGHILSHASGELSDTNRHKLQKTLLSQFQGLQI